MDDTIVVPDDEDEVSDAVRVSEEAKREAKRARDRAYSARKREAKKAAAIDGKKSKTTMSKLKSKKAVATHGPRGPRNDLAAGGGFFQQSKTTKGTPRKRAAKAGSKPVRAARKPPKGKLSMGHSYQRSEGVARGTEIAGGARQTVVTFPKAMFASVAKTAKANGTSFSEEVRRCVAKTHKA